MSRRHDVAEPAGHLDAQRKGMEQLAAAEFDSSCQSKNRGSDRRRGVDHRAQVRVVVVERGRGRGIDQRIVRRVGFAQHADLGLIARAQHAAGEVEDAALRLAAHRLRQVVPARVGDELREDVRGAGH
jgi:hypothetical protein